MKWDSETGVQPDSFETIMEAYFNAFKNADPKFESLAYNTFVASDEYKVFYASVQVDMGIENVIAMLFIKMSEFIQSENLKINNPTTTPNALMEGLENNFGFKSSVKPMIEEESGKMHVAIDYTPEPDLNYQIAKYMEQSAVVGSTYMVGDIAQDIVLRKGGIETYRWVQKTEQPLLFKLTIIKSRNSTAIVDNQDEIVSKFMANFEAFFWVGMDLEPEKYFEINRDAPYASDILTEYSFDDGENWSSEPYKTPYNIKFIGELPVANVIVQDL
ncbi:Whole genome shotgun sequence [Vibrio owensii]|uniref:Whole genome shotgun sequence n=1 Tax=Vibrio owensii TaxID=696485 RepID=A0AAU9PZP3_9VIBR|nr:Whole genome shotgun sequence [Vibrio owensii]